MKAQKTPRKTPKTQRKNRIVSPPKRLGEAQALWESYNYWLRSHPSPRWVFRGQSKDWEIKPSIGRIKKYSPATELQLLNMFKRSALPMIESSVIASNWDWLAVSQHHGLPTRLIDWTTNSLAAIFFATGAGSETKSNGVIVAIESRLHRFYRPENPDEVDPFDVPEAGFFYPPALAPRIAAQRGIFSIHPLPTQAWRVRAEEDRFIVPGHLKDEMRRILFNFGIDDAQLMADLDGLSRTLRWRYMNGIPLE